MRKTKLRKVVHIFFFVISICMLTACKSDLAEEEAEILITEEYAQLLDDMDNNPLISMLHSGFEVKVSSVSKSKGQYKIKCQLKNYDVYSTLKDMLEMSTEMSAEEYENTLTERLKEKEKVSETVELILTKDENGNYEVSFTEDQLDIATGYLLTFYAEILGQEVE